MNDERICVNKPAERERQENKRKYHIDLKDDQQGDTRNEYHVGQRENSNILTH